MDFGAEQRMSSRTLAGIGAVILLHIFLVYALVTGLATSAVELIKKPLEIKIIQAQTMPPPPPQVLPPPPPPILAAPPPPYVPPPLIQVQAPPQAVFAVTSSVKPAGPANTAPATPSTSVGVVCPNVGAVAKKLGDMFDSISDNTGVNSAQVVVEFTVTASGQVTAPAVVSSSFPGVNSLALAGVAALSCHGQGQDVRVRAPFVFQAD